MRCETRHYLVEEPVSWSLGVSALGLAPNENVVLPNAGELAEPNPFEEGDEGELLPNEILLAPKLKAPG